MTGTTLIEGPGGYELAEGPFWDPTHARLLWVDIDRGLVVVGDLDDAGLLVERTRIHVDAAVGAVAATADGGLLIAGRHELFTLAPGGTPRPLIRLLDEASERRLNDGAPDPRGRYLVGTLTPGLMTSSEELLAVDIDGAVRVLDDDLSLANGLAWSRDEQTLFTVDTGRRLIERRDYEPESGTTGPRSEFIRLSDGYPDGICLDAEGHLWVAVWGRGEVHRYTPAGRLDRVLTVPAPHVSSVAFAGPELRTLVITTARAGLSPAQREAWPRSGHLFTYDPGVAGHPRALWRGPTLIETKDA